jgi:hypothetical protein
MAEEGYTLEYLSGEKPKNFSEQQEQYNTYNNQTEEFPVSEKEPDSQNDMIYTQTTIQGDVIQIIRKNARAEWGNDERMYNYEVEQQTNAYNWYKAENNYPDILKKAKNEWQDDYRMVKYEYEQQIEAYEWLQRNKEKNPEAYREASSKWQDDYRMVKYEYEKYN